MTARIYKPAKTAMQSGRGKTRDWMLTFEPKSAQRPDPLMGWAGSFADTERQVTLRFHTQEEAVAYCQKRGLQYAVAEPQSSTVKPKSYADNFRTDRVR